MTRTTAAFVAVVATSRCRHRRRRRCCEREQRVGAAVEEEPLERLHVSLGRCGGERPAPTASFKRDVGGGSVGGQPLKNCHVPSL